MFMLIPDAPMLLFIPPLPIMLFMLPILFILPMLPMLFILPILLMLFMLPMLFILPMLFMAELDPIILFIPIDGAPIPIGLVGRPKADDKLFAGWACGADGGGARLKLDDPDPIVEVAPPGGGGREKDATRDWPMLGGEFRVMFDMPEFIPPPLPPKGVVVVDVEDHGLAMAEDAVPQLTDVPDGA
jgi:hypothetical protein